MLHRLDQLSIGVAGPVEAPSLAARLADVLGVDGVCLSMPIGPARANRKPVVQVTDREGNVLAYCKVGHDPLTTALVAHETEALRAVAAARPDFRAPAVLAGFEWLGGAAAVLEPLAIPAERLTGEEETNRLVDLVVQIAGIASTDVVPWRDHPHRDRLLDRAASCGSLAAELRAMVEELPGDLALPTGCWHGDLNSGNVAIGPDRTVVWDWERFEAGVPLGFDLLHHDLHRAITVRGAGPRGAAAALIDEAPVTLAAVGLEPESAVMVAKAYLLTLAARYAADDQSGAGADLGHVEDWVLPVVKRAGGGVKG